MSLSGFLQADEAMYVWSSGWVQWCDENFLELHVTKTAELVINFCHSKPSPDPLIIKGGPGQQHVQYKYLGTLFNNRLEQTANVDACGKTVSQRMFFLRKMKKFHLSSQLLHHFYQSVVQSTVLFNQVLHNTKKGDSDSWVTQQLLPLKSSERKSGAWNLPTTNSAGASSNDSLLMTATCSIPRCPHVCPGMTQPNTSCLST